MPVSNPVLDVHAAAGQRVAARARAATRILLQALALGGVVCLMLAAPLLFARQAVQQHRAERQAQVLSALGLALQAAPGGLQARLGRLPADTGGLAVEARVTDARNGTLAQWHLTRYPVLAPDLLVTAMALNDSPARMQVVVDGQPVGLEVRASAADLLDLAWQLLLATWLVSASVAAAAVVWAHLRQRRRDRLHEAQAEVLLLGQQRLFDAQAQQLDELRRHTHRDELTGLANRRYFLAQLDECLALQGDDNQVGLLLLRLQDLQGMNQRIGHATTDGVLQAMAQTLEAYPQRIERCAVGRLNGSDFVLLLPAAGLARETADSLQAALRLALLPLDALARVAIGAVELCDHSGGRLSARQALALADAALAEAEVLGSNVVHDSGLPPVTGEAVGEAGWQRRIARALAHGRAALGEFPVCTPDGRQLLLDCPLRVQLSAQGPFEPAQRWLALAVRSRLSAQVDEKAVALALAAIQRDDTPRCVNMSAQSLASPEFVASITRRLEALPGAACRLWIDLPEALALERPMLVRELSRRWRPLGAMLALEHCGEALMRIPRLIDLGLDCVRIDGRFVNGIAEPDAEAARRYLQGIVRLVQSVGMQATAEGVRAVADLEVLWQLGFDAATGPALSRPPVPLSSGDAHDVPPPRTAAPAGAGKKHTPVEEPEPSDFELA